MGFSVNGLIPEFSETYITVRAASKYSGYNQQYIRRLLRKGSLKTKKIGQIWLIDHSDFVRYLSESIQSKNRRFGPQGLEHKI
jgi:excisionase family DNA binding protein